ncbi:glycosyl hydrolase [Dictyobacter aurantiacus]|uniref:Asl1-like glycosyl hydrolase catalytic domain-containing protein n=1 Tax=Dictyobacter aurantiacus TaxID=1936993 RepID=A0A401ZQ95_9CHLR|nr:glycosyl hydrolase [Dictyobacter aurantiacus]GCE08926.1 hypothetical protein KDAU_62550 [Dictyobacter aurantiacus]
MQSTIFLHTEIPVFKLWTPASTGSLTYSVADRSGTNVVEGQVNVQSDQTIISLQQLSPEYYVLKITDHTTADDAPVRTIPFTVITSTVLPVDSRFGVSAHFSGKNPLNGTRELIAMGTSMVRDDALWADVETSPGEYDFTPVDRYMSAFQRSGVNPLLIIDYNNPLYDGGVTPYDESGFAAYANYARALVRHYPQLKAVEIYNEYNKGRFSTGPGAHDPANYARMVTAAYQAIKSVRPDVTVVVGATFGIDLDWLKDLFTAGALAYADAISVHPYSVISVDTPELRNLAQHLQALQDLIKEHNNGQTKPIWITELGWSDAFNITNEFEQAHYLVRSIVLSLSAGVDTYFWYDFINDGTNNFDLEQNFGLIRLPDADGYYTPKPSYTAFAVLTRLLKDRSFLGREVAEFNVYHMCFSSNLHVLWSTPFNQKIELASDGPLTSISMTGKTEILQPAGGKVTLRLTPEPIYILTETEQFTMRPLEQERPA